MATPAIQTLITDAQQVLNLKSLSEIRATLAAVLANANVGTPLNPNLTTQQLWDQFYEIVRQTPTDIESILVNQMMKFVFSPPAPGGAGANSQVIFNDGGVLAGDAGLTYNKTTDALTITGDLTVDTNVLKVDTTLNRVGIGTATPLSALHVGSGTGLNNLGVGLSRGATTNFYEAFDGTKTFLAGTDSSQTGVKVGSLTNHSMFLVCNNTTQLQIDPLGVFSFTDGAGGTRMTLNSTGLGVGVAPTEKLSVWGTSTVYGDARFNVGLFDPTSATTGTGSGISFAGYTNGVTVGATFAQIKGIKENSTAGNIAGAFVVSTLPNGGIPVERMRIDSVGNVGIGVTPSVISNVIRLEIGGEVSTNLTLRSSSTNASARNWMVGSNVNAFGDFVIRQSNSQGAEPNSGTDRLVLDASGNLLVGTTSQLYPASIARLNVDSGTAGTATFKTSGGSAQATLYSFNSATTGDNAFITFGTEAAFTSRGSVTYNRAGGLVAYNVTSDYRAKDIIGPVSNSGSLIDSLKVYVGKMKGATIERPMLIAHEAQEVAPYAVTGTKDEVDADGNPKYQQMDVSALVPVLIAEIQSLRARVQTLETR